MPDFIPDVIVTRTPIKDQGEGKQDQEMGDELDSILSDDHPTSSFSARPMPDFNKVEIPVKEKNPIKRRTPPHKEGETPVSSPVFKASPVPKSMRGEPSIPVQGRDPNKLRSPESFVKPTTPSSLPKSAAFRARPVPDSLYVEPSPIGKLKSPIRKTTLNSPVTSPPRIQRENQSSNSNDIMGDAKARLRERLSQRKSNAAAVKAATPDRVKSRNKNKNSNSNTGDKIMTSPKAFSTLRVQSLLNSHSQANAKREEQLQNSKTNNNIDSANNTASGSKTPKKSNSTIPKSIDLPLRSASPKTGKEANLLRETKLALAMGVPDGDESSSILQLAQEVQKAAEDELSFYSTADNKDHWSSSLADGRPHNLL